MKPCEKLKNKPGLTVSMIQNKKIVLGIGMIAVFLFAVFSISSYYKEKNSLTCPVFGWSVSIFDLIPVLVSLGVVVGAATYYTMSFKVEAKEKSLKKNIDIIFKFLAREERKVVEKLLENKGRMLQSDITRLEGMNKLRSHRTIKKLAEKGIVEVEGYGKTNNVRLVKEIKEGLM